MKRIFTLFSIMIALNVIAQENVIFSEDFEGDLSDWTVGDLDGDGHNWEAVYSSDYTEEQGWGPDMTLMAGSFGYNLMPGEEGALYPDNLLITPAIDFPADASIQLNFLLGTNVDSMNDHNFALYIVEDFVEFDDAWEPIFEMNFSEISTAQEISLDLSDYAGTTQQLVMRHYNSGEQFVLLLDDIMIEANTLNVTDPDANIRLTVYPNPAQDFVKINTIKPLETVEFYNVQGKLVKTSHNPEISIIDLPRGVYVLKIKTDTEFFTKKLIKK